jgi:hypothetical protein
LLHAASGTPLDFLSPIFALLSVSLFVGGIPYVLVAGVLLWILRHREADAYRRLSFIAPPVFAVVLFLAFSIYAFFGTTPGGDLRGALFVGAFYAAFAIPVGYLYVCLAHGVYWILARRGYLAARGAAQQAAEADGRGLQPGG